MAHGIRRTADGKKETKFNVRRSMFDVGIKFQIPSTKSQISTNDRMIKTKKTKSLILKVLSWAESADLCSLQKKIPKAFVLNIGIWNLEFIWNLELVIWNLSPVRVN
ncbi:MAG: hypothetical protein ABII93_06200 [Chrysiogenia bacterium]